MNLANTEAEVGKLAREITVKRVAIVAVVNVLIQFALVHGWLSADLSHQTENIVNGALDLISAIVAAGWVRGGVTPLNDPRDSQGNKLTPDTK